MPIIKSIYLLFFFAFGRLSSSPTGTPDKQTVTKPRQPLPQQLLQVLRLQEREWP